MLVSLSTGATFPARCGSNRCAYCLPRNAFQRSNGIAWACPERAILLTQVGDTWADIRARMKRVRYEVAKETRKPFEWVWHVEPNPKGTGNHVHAWTKGAFVPVRRLSAIADTNGMGAFARINRVRSVEGASQYGLKGLGYGMKAVRETPEAARVYLELNGGRLTHQSRGFFASGDGGTIGVRAAQSAANTFETRDPGPWAVTWE